MNAYAAFDARGSELYGRAAVDANGLTVDVCRFIAAQKRDQIGDFLTFCEAAAGVGKVFFHDAGFNAWPVASPTPLFGDFSVDRFDLFGSD